MAENDLLDENALTEALRGLPGWEHGGDATIVRYAKLPSFPEAIAAVDEVANLAEEHQHHPDIDIRYNTLKFTLSTHSEGGITAKDTDMAGRINTVIDAKLG